MVESTNGAEAVVLLGLIGANLLSILGCAWVLHRLNGRRPMARRQRLIPRLIASLACSDLLMHVIIAIMNLPQLVMDASLGDDAAFCPGVQFVFHFFRFVSVLQEAHIACYFVLQAYKCKSSLFGDRRSIGVVWLMGTILTVADIAVVTGTLGARSDWCSTWHNLRVSFAVLSACFAISLLTYIMVLARSCQRAPGSVVRDALRRAAIYPLNFLLTYSLVLLAQVYPSLWRSPVFAISAAGLEGCNGLFNAFAYACQGRYSITAPFQAGSGGPHVRSNQVSSVDGIGAVSFRVEVGGVEVLEFLAHEDTEEDVSLTLRGF